MARITELPSGVTVRHGTAGCPIEIVTWRSGGEITIEKVTPRRARELAIELQAAALREEAASGFWYLASVYTKHPGGLDEAYEIACQAAALFLRAGVPVFCPIAHTHVVATAAAVSPIDHAIWLPFDRPMMEAAKGLIILQTPGWELSEGIDQERKYFKAAGKPERFMTPGKLPDLT